ncbi:LrgB family protein [Microbulbifer thermotolerans]|uniref:LrgB family protein n=1 Tax=Microbulbifer thermotolerans TaxID=252514 RepID=UPI0008E86B83|nr:LrgB family protein [Microbulbifer thermotolerans]MCX2783792.1 LrgB family protein [Microbulbifer thermotolerans]MCX2830676.1 LrgB family protein [Microbulbifer thermotolerans]WKT60486.1 LrgB family protein [Microbulbifer thermotolerans]SFC12627.1 Putative effector of murein hydrolase [Microbulbifer thermotolerans]
MTDFLLSPLFAMPLNLCAFLLGLALYRRTNTALLHPIVGAGLMVAAVLWSLDIPYDAYREASGVLYVLLGPAVVALAVPVKQNLTVVRQAGWPLAVTIAVGALLAPITAMGIALILGATQTVLMALTGKSITTPIAMALAEKIHTAQSLAAGIAVFTGVVGAVAGPPLLNRLNIRDHRVIGIALGVNAHAVGTARALEISALCGAFAALAMGLCGALTAMVLPLLLSS